MRILHVTSSIDVKAGGTAVAVLGLARAQASAAGSDVMILTTERQGDSTQYVDAAGVATRLLAPATGKLVRHPDLARAAREMVAKADIVHVHALWEEAQHQAAVAARAARVPYVFTPHGMLDPWSLAQRALLKRLYLAWRLRRDLNGAAALHCTSETEAALVAPLRLRPPTIIESNGVDLAEFDNLPPRGAFRAKHAALADGRPMILFLGRLHYKKGFDLLIPALARMRTRDAVLVVAGPDADGYRSEIERMIAAAGVGGRVIFTGMLRGRERVEACADADLFVLPSYQENFGIAVVEALAAGCPVVISDQVNIWREIEAGGVGASVPTAVGPLADMLDRWIRDSALRAAAAGRARAFVSDRYDWNQIARRWREHYDRIIRERSSRPVAAVDAAAEARVK